MPTCCLRTPCLRAIHETSRHPALALLLAPCRRRCASSPQTMSTPRPSRPPAPPGPRPPWLRRPCPRGRRGTTWRARQLWPPLQRRPCPPPPWGLARNTVCWARGTTCSKVCAGRGGGCWAGGGGSRQGGFSVIGSSAVPQPWRRHGQSQLPASRAGGALLAAPCWLLSPRPQGVRPHCVSHKPCRAPRPAGFPLSWGFASVDPGFTNNFIFAVNDSVVSGLDLGTGGSCQSELSNKVTYSSNTLKESNSVQ